MILCLMIFNSDDLMVFVSDDLIVFVSDDFSFLMIFISDDFAVPVGNLGALCFTLKLKKILFRSKSILSRRNLQVLEI
jgi:hypothetical protein